jgi:transcriptional regulator with XRE-family HTH domain
MNTIRRAREQQGFSQTAFAARVGIGQGTLSDFENNKRICWPKLRRKIARALGVPESDLFDEKGRVLEVGNGDES